MNSKSTRWLFCLLLLSLPALACLRSANTGVPYVVLQRPTATPSLPFTTIGTSVTSQVPAADPEGTKIPVDTNATPETAAPLSLQSPITAAITGLSWYSDTLLVLTANSEAGQPGLLLIAKGQLIQVESNPSAALAIQTVPMDVSPLRQALPGFSTFQSLAVMDDQVFFTLQAGNLDYLVSGKVAEQPLHINLDPSRLARISQQDGFPSRALLPAGSSIMLFPEAPLYAPGAAALIFDVFLNEKGNPVQLPRLDGSLLAATPADDSGHFWVLLQPAYPADRVDLVELQFTEEGIQPGGQPFLRLPPGSWQAVARLDAHTLILAGNGLSLVKIP